MKQSKGLRVLVCALAALVIRTAEAQSQSSQREQREFRVYDVSDLLPEAVRAFEPVGKASVDARHPLDVMGMRRVAPVIIAMNMAMMMDVESVELGPGVIGILAESAGHKAFAHALDALHDTYQERAAVQLAVYQVESGASVPIGSHPDPDWDQPIRQIQQAIHRLSPTPMNSVTVRRFTSSVIVIAGTGGFGYQPQTEEVTEGLDLEVRIGPSNKESVSLVEVRGVLVRVNIRQEEMKGYINPPNASPGEAVGRFELPVVDRRPIHSAIRARDGEETVIAVMDDPASEMRLVVTVKVSAVQ